MIKGIKLLGFKSWLWWKKEELTYKFRQRKYWKAVEVLDEVLERKLNQVNGEPKQEMWKEHAGSLRQASELIEEDIPYLNPNY